MAEKLPVKKKRRRWPWVLAAGAALFLAWIALSNWMDDLNNRFFDLNNHLGEVSSYMSRQINSVSGRVEEILQAQNSLLADYGANVSGSDLGKNAVTIAARATPKTYVEGLEVIFLADCGDGKVTEVPGTDDGNHRFSAHITCPLTDSITVSVVLIDGDTRQTQVLESFVGLYTDSFPEVQVQDYAALWGLAAGEDGLFHFDESRGTVEVTPILYAYESAAPEGFEPAGIEEVKAGLFKNRELIAWLTPEKAEKGRWTFRIPVMDFAAQEGDEIWFAALITDSYGRRRMALDIPPMLVEDGVLEKQSGAFDWRDYSYEPEDWGV